MMDRVEVGEGGMGYEASIKFAANSFSLREKVAKGRMRGGRC